MNMSMLGPSEFWMGLWNLAEYPLMDIRSAETESCSGRRLCRPWLVIGRWPASLEIELSTACLKALRLSKREQ